MLTLPLMQRSMQVMHSSSISLSSSLSDEEPFGPLGSFGPPEPPEADEPFSEPFPLAALPPWFAAFFGPCFPNPLPADLNWFNEEKGLKLLGDLH